MKIRRLAPACLLITALTAVCKRDPVDPPGAVVARYQADAQAYCEAVVDCMKADVQKRLAAEPERRDMVLDRMDRDLCLEGQFQLLGRLSVDPSGKKTAFDPAHYETYSACTKAVTEADSCEARLTTHQQNPACQNLRQLQER